MLTYNELNCIGDIAQYMQDTIQYITPHCTSILEDDISSSCITFHNNCAMSQLHHYFSNTMNKHNPNHNINKLDLLLLLNNFKLF